MHQVTLVTSLGDSPYEETEYSVSLPAGEVLRVRSQFAPVASASFLRKSGKAVRAAVLATRAAFEANGAALRKSFADKDIHLVEERAIPEEQSEDSFEKTVETLLEVVGEGETVALDLTYGWRYLPLLYFVALSYLTALKDVRLEDVFYANRTGHILRLAYLPYLARWFERMAMARCSGDYRPLASLLHEDTRPLLRGEASGHEKGIVNNIVRHLRNFSACLSNGLPLEAGIFARLTFAGLEEFHTMRVPMLSKLAVDSLRERLDRYKTPATKKCLLELSREELERQLCLAKDQVELNNFATASEVLREYVVNAYILLHGDRTKWLDKDVRDRAETCLKWARKRCESNIASDADKTWANAFSRIGDIRNIYAHAGMRPEQLRLEQKKKALCDVLETARGLLQEEPGPIDCPRGSGCIALVPVGLSPGVLYTILLGQFPEGGKAAPQRVLCVCSRESKRLVDEALARVERQPACELIQFDDVHTGVSDINTWLRQHASRVVEQCAQYEEIIACATGGTTLMGYVVERLAARCLDLGMRVRRVATIDRRSIAEQQQNPWVVGDIIELDG